MKKVLARATLALLVAVFAFMPDVQSQQRRRTSRRTTNPARPQPVQTPTLSDEPAVVSTADEGQPTPRRTTTRTSRQQQQPQQNTQAENEQLRGTVRDLSGQVEELSGQLNQLKADQRAMFDLERLSRAEQRAEQLRTQLREVTDKEFQLQERLAEIEYESTSEAIQRRAALVGSLNPSAVRNAIEQQLGRERIRINKQLELLGASRTRLEAAVATADAEVERLRQRVEANDQAQQSPTNEATLAAPTATPQPSPTPEAQPPM